MLACTIDQVESVTVLQLSPDCVVCCLTSWALCNAFCLTHHGQVPVSDGPDHGARQSSGEHGVRGPGISWEAATSQVASARLGSGGELVTLFNGRQHYY